MKLESLAFLLLLSEAWCACVFNRTQTDPQTLENGVPLCDWTAPLTIKQYQFNLNGLNSTRVNLMFALTPISGLPDMFVSWQGPPNATFYTYRASWPTAGIPIQGSLFPQATIWYIGVLSYSTNASYTLLADLHCNSCGPMRNSLLDGVPQLGLLTQTGEYDYYKIPRPDSDTLRITVTRFVGNPRVYIQNDGTFAYPTNYKWALLPDGDDTVVIPNTPGVEEYDISVLNERDYAVAYSILASTESTSPLLVESVPFRGKGDVQQYNYYQFMCENTISDLIFTVTPLNGDVVLYLSTTNPTPNANNFELVATRPAIITIPANQTKIHTYYLSVYSVTNTSFTITTSLSNQQTMLQNGIPQLGQSTGASFVYYEFFVIDYSNITLTLTALSGSPIMYISTGGDLPNSTNYLYKGANVRIDPRHACNQCSFIIGVQGFEWDSNLWSILYVNTETSTSLIEGLPQGVYSNANENLYFIFNLLNTNVPIKIHLTPLAGEANLYVSTTLARPNSTNYTWKAVAFEATVITVQPSDLTYTSGLWHIGVSSSASAFFTIMVTSLTSTTCVQSNKCLFPTLLSGVPQISYTQNLTGTIEIYSFFLTSGSLQFSIVSLYGLVNLYISNNGRIPTSNDYTWKLSDQTGVPSFIIYPFDPNFCENCTYLITVTTPSVVYNSTNYYSLTATSSQGQAVLEDGIPVLISLDYHLPRYYVVIATDPTSPLMISTSSQDGNYHVYISIQNNRPNKDYYDWTLGVNEQFIIDQPMFGQYWISVYCDDSCSLSLQAGNGHIVLLDGSPLVNQLRKGELAHYSFFLPEQKDFTVTLNVKQGDPTIYISNQYGTWPNPSDAATYNWTTLNGKSTLRYTITIPSTDKSACFNCVYFICIASLDTYSTFSITALLGSKAIGLLNNQPFTLVLKPTTYTYFLAHGNEFLPETNFFLTSFTGSTHLYISTDNTMPTQDTSQWSSLYNSQVRGHSITVYPPQDAPVPNFYYIGVYALEESYISLTYSTDIITVRPGLAQVGNLGSSGIQIFHLPVNEPSNIMISILPFNSSAPYVSYTANIYTFPGTNSSNLTFLWSQQMEENDVIQFTPNQIGTCGNCTYHIQINGTLNRNFVLLTTANNAAIYLFDTIQYTSIVGYDEFRYFQLYSATAQDLSVYVQTCTGNNALYMSKDIYFPNPTQYEWSSIHDDQNEYIALHDSSLLHQEFYISVQGNSQTISNQFTILGRTYSPAEPTNPIISDPSLVLAAVDSKSVKITYTPAQPANQPIDSSNLIYTLLWTLNNHTSAVLYSLCGLNGVAFATAGDSVATLEEVTPGSAYQFNILVEDVVTGGSALYRPLYNVRIPDPSTPGKDVNLTMILSIGLGVGIPSILFLIYLFVQCQRLTNQKEQTGGNVTAAVDRHTGTSRDSALLPSAIHSDDEPTSASAQEQFVYMKPPPTPPVSTERLSS